MTFLASLPECLPGMASAPIPVHLSLSGVRVSVFAGEGRVLGLLWWPKLHPSVVD